MRWLTVLGFLVLAMTLASGGVLHGSICAGHVGCIGATDNGLTLRSAP